MQNDEKQPTVASPIEPVVMCGSYTPFCDGYGIVGWHYNCPKCKHETRFSDSEQGCEDCGYSEDYVDPDEWYDYRVSLPIGERWLDT